MVKKIILIAGLSLGFLGGCASSPISQNYRQEAKNVPFREIQQNPGRYIGATVIWGGRILETTNTPQGTEMTVLETPLDEDQAPTDPAGSEGRFIATTPNFMDPEIFSVGKYVTVAGKVMGSESRPLGKGNYNYPVITIEQYYLWTSTAYPPAYYYPGYGYGNPYWGYGYPYYDWDWDYGFWGGPIDHGHFEHGDGEHFEHGDGEHFEHGDGEHFEHGDGEHEGMEGEHGGGGEHGGRH